MPHETQKIPLISEVVRQGACSRFCGRCCSVAHWRQHPLFEQQVAAIFAELGENAHGDCAKLTWVNGQAVCSIYDDRPEMCRQFPNHPLAIETIPECSYRFAERTGL